MMLLGRRQVVSPGTTAAPDGRAEQLREAAVRGDSDTVVRLTSDGVKFEPDEAGRTAMHLACSAGHANVVASLILNGADVNKPDEAGCSPLQRAAAEGHLEVVRQLLRHGADVNHQDEVHGNTPLHEASWKGFSRCVTALTRAKAIDMTLKNRGGFAALHLCCQNGHNQSCRELLLNGCSADLQNNYGDTPLHTSARYGHAGVTRILISAKCRVSDQNKNGDTALHIAAAMGRRKLTRILLEAGCDKSLKNKQGETSRDIATRKDLTEILAILNVPAAAAAAASSSSPADKRASRRGKKSSRPDPTSKKREKTESGTSSKDSSTRHKEKKKAKQNGTGKVHFEKMKMKMTEGGKQWSPYGCHYYPDPQAFPQPNLDSLPHEPLKRGEQYFLDLAGNICKGPVGVGYTCYCAPFFKNMEARLDRDKQELKEHIDAAHARLDEKVSSLERRTHGRIEELSRNVAAERAECTERHAHLSHWLHGELSRGGAYRASERVPQRVERQPSVVRARSLEDLLDERPRRSRAPAVLTHNGSVNDILESTWPDRTRDNAEFRPVNADNSRWEQELVDDDEDGASSESSEGEGEDQIHEGLELRPKINDNSDDIMEYHGKTPDYENLAAYKEQWIRGQKSWSPDEDRWRMDDTGKWIRQENYNERWVRRDWVPENESSSRSWSREDHRSETHDARLLVASLGLRSRTAVYSNGTSPATDATADTPNDSGYSTKVYGSSKGPSPELPEGYVAGQLPPPSPLAYYPPRLNGTQPSTAAGPTINNSAMAPPKRRNVANASLV